MDEKILNKIEIIRETCFVMFMMILPGICCDLFYWNGSKYWVSSKWVVLLLCWNISYSNSFKILGSNFGVIITIVSMFLTINNNISERFEKKVYGIPRAELYSKEKWLYKHLRRLCLIAPVLLLLFLNLKFCISGYLVFLYCIAFLLWHYYRHSSSFSRPLEETVKKLKETLPVEETWTKDIFDEYQMLLENIGKSAEESGNWKEIEKLYDKLLAATEEYDSEKQYLISFYFYQIVFWKREKRSRIAPMGILQTYIERWDMEIKGADQIPAGEWPVLWGMMRVAICEADVDELIRFLQWFFDFPARSCNVLRKSEQYALKSKIMEEQAGMVLVLLEYRFRSQPPENIKLVDCLKEAWEKGRYSFLEEDFIFASKISVFSHNSFEGDTSGIETVLENLRKDFQYHSNRSLIANII